MDIAPLEKWIEGYERQFDVAIHLDDASTDDVFFDWADTHVGVVVVPNDRVRQGTTTTMIGFEESENPDVTANAIMQVVTSRITRQVLESAPEQNTGA